MGDDPIILAIDPATNTGWAAFNKVEPVPYFSHGRFKVVGGLPLKEYYERIEELVDRLRPSIVYIEDYFFHKTQCSGSALNYQFRAVVFLVLQQRNVPYVVVAPTTWKKSVAGRGRPNVQDVEKYGTKANKEFVRAALDKGYAVAELTSDEVDAYGILHYAMNK